MGLATSRGGYALPTYHKIQIYYEEDNNTVSTLLLEDKIKLTKGGWSCEGINIPKKTFTLDTQQDTGLISILKELATAKGLSISPFYKVKRYYDGCSSHSIRLKIILTASTEHDAMRINDGDLYIAVEETQATLANYGETAFIASEYTYAGKHEVRYAHNGKEYLELVHLFISEQGEKPHAVSIVARQCINDTIDNEFYAPRTAFIKGININNKTYTIRYVVHDMDNTSLLKNLFAKYDIQKQGVIGKEYVLTVDKEKNIQFVCGYYELVSHSQGEAFLKHGNDKQRAELDEKAATALSIKQPL